MSAQNTWYTVPGVNVPSVVTISGRYVLDAGVTSQTQTWANFLNRTQQQVEDQLRNRYLVDFPEVRTNTRGTIIIDLEGDADGNTTHPSFLHEYSTPDQLALVTAWKLRIAATRAVYPYAKLGLYAVIIPDSRGLASETYLAREAALIAAGTTVGGAGYDQLDYLAPVVYPYFGPNDTAGQFGSYYAMTAQACGGAQKVKKSDGSSIPVLPMLGAYVSNGNSNDHEVMLLDFAVADPLGVTWGEQFRAFRDYGIDEAVFWNGENSPYCKKGDGGEMSTRLVSEFVHAGKGWG